MGLPARTNQPADDNLPIRRSHERPAAPLASLPATNLPPAGSGNASMRLIDQPESPRPKQAVVRGLKELQQLQKQTIAVLDAVRGNLEDIRQVLRSPEATRGMEKQQNAAALLAKGFAHEAALQAADAVALLPANPDAHLLLSLSLASNQQFDDALAATRKGLALFDRAAHPLAIEAGLLHALATLGHSAEAATRWQEIIERLPLPILFEHLPRIVNCFPVDAPEELLDSQVARRIVDEPTGLKSQLQAADVMRGLDHTNEARLTKSHRAILARVATLAGKLDDPSDVIRFLTEYVLPLTDRGLKRSSAALGTQSVKKLLAHHADVLTLHRAMLKLEIGGCQKAERQLAEWLWHWRVESDAARRATHTWGLAMVCVALGFAGVIAPLYPNHTVVQQAIQNAPQWLARRTVQQVQIGGAAMVCLGALLVLARMFGRNRPIDLPAGRAPLSREERTFLRRRSTRADIKRILNSTAGTRHDTSSNRSHLELRMPRD
jgi:tetratricopeptide (TPR) repeat protein